VIALFSPDIVRNVFVTTKAELVLFGPAKGNMARCTFGLQVGVRLNDIAWHQQRFDALSQQVRRIEQA